MLDDKEFLDKIHQKADKQKKDRAKKRRHLAAAGSCLALFLLVAVFIFPNTAVKDKSLSNGTGCSEEYDGKEADSFPSEPAPEFTSDENQPEIVCSPPFSEAILITTAEKATEQGLHRAEPFFEEKALLLFTAEEYPKQTDCEILTEQSENSLQITVTPSQNTEVKAKTQFLLEINKTDLQKIIRIIQKKEAQP